MITQRLNIRLQALKQARLPAILVVGGWFVFFAGFLSLAAAMDVDLLTAPQFPGSQIIWKERPLEINGIQARAMHLRCDAEREQVRLFYKEALEKGNWSLEQQSDYYVTNILTFRNKEGRFLYVVVFAQGFKGASDVYILASSRALSFCPALSASLLKEELAPDTSGKDISDIPRFPASRRRLNILLSWEGALVVYEADAAVAEIADFYRKNFKMIGWHEDEFISTQRIKKIYPEMDTDSVEVLSFSKDSDRVEININLLVAPSMGKRSLITITKNIDNELNPRLTKEKQ